MTEIGPKRPTVERTVFSTSRAAEFLEVRALQAQTGQPAKAFGHVVVKELLDNALDAAESAGRAPVIEIATRTDEYNEITFVTVTDNGAGITPATVTSLCDFNMLVSDKARYRGPTRGAQGNAFKTLLGIPYALGVTEPVVIESAGVRHELRVTLDQVGDVVVTDDKTTSDRTVGTSVAVPLPDHLDVDAQRWAYGAKLVNPHATIGVSEHAQTGDDFGDENRVLYKSAGQAWSKWMPSMPSSPHWYDEAAFSALVHSHIRTGVSKPIGGFIGEFEGLKTVAKQKAVRASVPGFTHLSDLQDRDDLIDTLHQAMLSHAKPTLPKRLGPVGEDYLKTMLNGEYGPGVYRMWYRAEECVVDGVPWVIEVAVADTIEPGDTWFACNHSPSFGDPLDRADLETDDINVTGAESFLMEADATSDDDDKTRAAVVHVICAAPQFTDKGKVALVVPAAVEDYALAALDKATKTLRKEAEQRRKDASKAERAVQRAREEAARKERKKKPTKKEVVFEVLREAKAAAGFVVAVRTLYYKVRPLFLKYLPDAVLDYNHFSQMLVPEYEREYGPLNGLYYEARGELHHPHDSMVTQLGTREVGDYELPKWQFDKVLYVEKAGLAAQLAPYRLGQKYDMAIIYGQGYSPTACRNLLARPEFRDMQVFVLHDADIDGYNIARTLGEATARMPDHNVEIIDLGLTVPQAIEYGLETEEYVYKKELPVGLELDDDAQEWFTGNPFHAGNGKTHYRCTRCELNAFSSHGLAAFIEDGLARHGVTPKIVPPPDVLNEYVRSVRDKALTNLVWAEIADMFDIATVKRQLIADHPDLADVDEARIRDTFADDPTRSWRSSAQHLVNEDIDATPGLADAVRAHLAEQLATPQDHEE
jgi:DNA topoisomerase VI subunit B